VRIALVLIAAVSAACRGPQVRGVAAQPSPSTVTAPAGVIGIVEAPVSASERIDLWPEGVPDRLSDAPPERIEDGRVYNVGNPTIAVFPPPAAIATGTAVIVCPGGGYVRLAVDSEGTDVTRWLNTLGVTAFVLKYRVAPYKFPAALRDVLRAVRVVRARASEFSVDPTRIGVFGSSAGGHVAASASTLFDALEGKTGAPLDAVDGRPDFQILLYPVITMREPLAHAGSRRSLLPEPVDPAIEARASVELQVNARTPRAFIVHTAEDASVSVENPLLYYRALREQNVPVELHLYERGPHGFGLKTGFGPTSEWPKRCEEWLRFHGFLPAARPG
jgi:acetyl esterase/lipase